MQIMGTNTWETDVPPDMLVRQALKFAEAVKADGIAELRGAWIASDEQKLWCTWDTENLDALEVAFAEMNEQSGLESQLTTVETFFPD